MLKPALKKKNLLPETNKRETRVVHTAGVPSPAGWWSLARCASRYSRKGFCKETPTPGMALRITPKHTLGRSGLTLYRILTRIHYCRKSTKHLKCSLCSPSEVAQHTEERALRALAYITEVPVRTGLELLIRKWVDIVSSVTCRKNRPCLKRSDGQWHVSNTLHGLYPRERDDHNDSNWSIKCMLMFRL